MWKSLGLHAAILLITLVLATKAVLKPVTGTTLIPIIKTILKLVTRIIRWPMVVRVVYMVMGGVGGMHRSW